MTRHIAVHLPERMVEFLDHAVASGKAPSRAALVAGALRRHAAENDVEILRKHGNADELDDLVAWSGSHAAIED